MNASLKVLARCGIAISLSIAMTSAFPSCVCRCTNGENVPICNNPNELPPICPPVLCPLAPPTIQPIQQPVIPPIGTTDCWKQQVLNPVTGRYEWRTLCK